MFANCLHPGIGQADCMAWEFDLFRDFVCDFVVGDFKRSAFVFIELEDAKPNGIFAASGRATSEWGRRFERGFSQIADWAYKLDDQERSDAFEDHFGARAIHPKYVLVIGRSAHLSPSEMRRLRWREQHVLVRSQQIRCLTYDELLEDLELAMVYPQL